MNKWGSIKNLLKELLEENEYKQLDLEESIAYENHIIISELVNPQDHYSYTSVGKCWFKFYDIHEKIHNIRLLKNGDEFDVKLWFEDENGRPNYNRPNVYYKMDYDSKIYNTHFYIILNEIIPYFFEKLPNEKLNFPFIDKARFRLFKIDFNKFLDKNLYNINYENNKIIIVKNEDEK